MAHSVYEFLLRAFAFVLGAAVGSFLNVCIYRWPVDLSINKPRRSFCPACKQPIPWHQNLPLVSWIWLGGRCANCGTKIAFRYFAVELITALLFLAIWQSFPWQMAIAYWIFVSLLSVGTFIDLEHFIIPDRVTVGGIVAGVACSVAVPALMEADSRLAACVRSLLAAALGYVILLIVLEAGKIAFGRKRIEFDAPTPFIWTKRGDDADLVVGTEESLWSDYFAREKDRLLLECDEAKIDHHIWQRDARLPLRSRHCRRPRDDARRRGADFWRSARTRDSSRSNGPGRLEISRGYWRVSRVARGFV